MDEIRSSRALEEEVKEEARRRADKLLKDAARECEAVQRRGRERLDRELAELSARYERRKEAFSAETAARMPLERKRRRLIWAEARLRSALDACLSSITPGRLSSIVLRRLRLSLDAFTGKELRILWNGIDEKALLEALAPELERRHCRIASSEEAGKRPGLAVESLDGSVRFHADLEDLREELLDAKRAELATALLGDMEGK